MTINQVMDSLDEIKNKEENIRRKKANISMIKEQAYSISALYYGDKVRSSKNNSKIEDNIIKIENAEKALRDYEKAISLKQATMLSHIQELPENQSSVILMFYYKNMKAVEIAEAMQYSEKNIWVIKKAAIEKLAEIIQ